MEWKKKFFDFIKKYKHAWVFLYLFIYLPWWIWLEKHVTTHYYVVQTEFDKYIPFIEYFIVPYLLWFFFIVAAFMFSGMTIFLLVSTVFPNGQDLRPVVFERDNIFVDMVRMLYRTDTCTNVFPSLHVFNSLSVCVAVFESRELKKHRTVSFGVYTLAGLIILATMFLKQHSVLDTVGACIMAWVLYQFVYAPQRRRVPGYSKEKRPVL